MKTICKPAMCRGKTKSRVNKRKKEPRASDASAERLVHVAQNVAQDFERRLGRVNAMHKFFAVEIQHRPGFLVVSFQPGADDFEIGVVEALFPDPPASPTTHKCRTTLAPQT